MNPHFTFFFDSWHLLFPYIFLRLSCFMIMILICGSHILQIFTSNGYINQFLGKSSKLATVSSEWFIAPHVISGLSTCTWWRHQMETFSALLAIYLCVEFTGLRWILLRKASDAELFFDLFSLICWINGWVNNGEAGDLRRHRAHYDAIVMGRVPLKSYRSVDEYSR